ncbi:hypothetical protein B296_00014353 [Ensete ventricosum]|uniref:Uncharacterized protein n=1 Tax=Ensete ventricosum TaxID=4639 RepID=A0A427B4M5_ENSVE|nr:hypothetical protein B296_00014353 [Ensete ventricosum]
MGFLLRVRLPSFGAATASLAGFYLLSTDFLLAHDAVARQFVVDIAYYDIAPMATIVKCGGANAGTSKLTCEAASAQPLGHLSNQNPYKTMSQSRFGKIGAAPRGTDPRGLVDTCTRLQVGPLREARSDATQH